MPINLIKSWFSLSLPSSSNAYDLDESRFNDLLKAEYPSLHSSELIYLDHAASQPPPLSALTAFTAAMCTTFYSNPHSHAATEREIDRMRSRVMRTLFGLDEREQEGWDLVWTSGASASLKLVGENFAWIPNATYRYTKDSHTSLVGIRGCALAAGARVESLDLDQFLALEEEFQGPVLHAYPAQCNVTGARLGIHPALTLSRAFKSKEKHAVLIDAPAYLSTSMFDLSIVPYGDAPDFVAGSFYKIYGHPTGLGFLLVKRTSAHFLTSSSPSPKNAYFGGGSIDAISVSAPFWVYPRGSKPSTPHGIVHERFEQGTIAFLSIVALRHAMDAHEKLFSPKLSDVREDHLAPERIHTASIRAVSSHTRYIVNLARISLENLKHWDGTPLVRIHRGVGSGRWEEDGPIIAFTLQMPLSSSYPVPSDGDGCNGEKLSGPKLIGHAHIMNLATLANIQLRVGGLCNTATIARVSGLSDDELKELWERGRVCGDAQEFGGPNGDKPLGLVRISFGACSSESDVKRFVEFLTRYFLVSEEIVDMGNEIRPSAENNKHGSGEADGVYLSSLVRYPIKSCAGQRISSSAFTSAGLMYDREFMLIDSANGKQISQKQFPRMVLIKPVIDEGNEHDVMKVMAPRMAELLVKLTDSGEENDHRQNERLGSYRVSVEADEWFTTFLGVPCQLHRFLQPTSTSNLISSAASSCSMGLLSPIAKATVPILFSNESPFTLISSTSVDAVNDWVKADNVDTFEGAGPVQESCFRANFTIASNSPLPAFYEDTLSHILIGKQIFQVLARCRRCLMICVDPERGVRLKEPFCTLAKHRRSGRQRVEFGMHLLWRKDLSGGLGGMMPREVRISVGDRVGWTVAVA